VQLVAVTQHRLMTSTKARRNEAQSSVIATLSKNSLNLAYNDARWSRIAFASHIRTVEEDQGRSGATPRSHLLSGPHHLVIYLSSVLHAILLLHAQDRGQVPGGVFSCPEAYYVQVRSRTAFHTFLIGEQHSAGVD